VPVSFHGITSNLVVQRSIMPNVFEEAVQRGPAEVAAGEETSRE